jgi:putative membrane protein
MKKYLACTVALIIPAMVGGMAFAQTGAIHPAPTAVAPTPPVPSTIRSEPTSTAPTSAAMLSSSDKAFVEKAAQGGVAEVQMAQLAQQKADNADVKQFAQTMIDEHTPNNEQLVKLATSKGLTPPTDPSAMQQKMMTHLQGLSGSPFDKAYIKGQVKAHTVMLKLFQSEAKTTRDPELKSFATETTTAIEHHLSMAQGLAKTGA